MGALGSWLRTVVVIAILWFIALGAVGIGINEMPGLHWVFIVVCAIVGLFFVPGDISREERNSNDERRHREELAAIEALNEARTEDRIALIDARTINVDNRQVIIHGETPKEKQNGRKEERRIGPGSRG